MAWSKDKGKLAKQYGDFAKAQGERAEVAAESITQLEYIAPYNANTQYQKNNIVRKDKNSYIALQPTLGNEPTGIIDSPFWGVIAIGGEDGTGNGTVTSVNGVGPDEIGNVSITIPDPDLSGLVTKQELQAVDDTLTSHLDVESTNAHSISNINGLQKVLDGKSTFSGDYRDLTHKPTPEDLSALSTTDKSSLVNAINEVNAKPSGGGGEDNWVLLQSKSPTVSDRLYSINQIITAYKKIKLVFKALSGHHTVSSMGVRNPNFYLGFPHTQNYKRYGVRLNHLTGQVQTLVQTTGANSWNILSAAIPVTTAYPHIEMNGEIVFEKGDYIDSTGFGFATKTFEANSKIIVRNPNNANQNVLYEDGFWRFGVELNMSLPTDIGFNSGVTEGYTRGTLEIWGVPND